MSQRRQRAFDFARGLTVDELLDRLQGEHPCALAQTIGVSGRGTAREVAAEIVHQLPSIEKESR